MNTIDLTKKLQDYKSGWVALDEQYNVVAHAETFMGIEEKVRSRKGNVVLLPASDNYFGFVTHN